MLISIYKRETIQSLLFWAIIQSEYEIISYIYS